MFRRQALSSRDSRRDDMAESARLLAVEKAERSAWPFSRILFSTQDGRPRS
jgi:hypothetical protein